MKAFAPLIREAKIAFYQWARRDMQRKGGMDPDLPKVLQRLSELLAQRPRIEPPRRSRCADVPGLCAGDPSCEDYRCPRLCGLYQRDGGMEVRGPLSFPIEYSTLKAKP